MVKKLGTLTEIAEAIRDNGRPTDAQVEKWLDAHPEATTTVQDGSLTPDKMNNAFWEDDRLKKVNAYVSPEMFGAIGNGIDDDTWAIKAAFDTGRTVVFSKGKTYVLSESIEIKRNGEESRHTLVINNGCIKYIGTSHAFILTGCEYSTLKLGTVMSDTGGVLLIRNSADHHTVYINIEFDIFTVPNTKSAVTVDINSSRFAYVNDIRFRYGKFSRGKSAIKFVKCADSSAEYGGYRFLQCAFEGVTCVADLATNDTRMEFMECRLQETVDKFATYDSEYESANRLYTTISWYGDSSLYYFRGLKNVLARFYGEFTQGNFRLPAGLTYVNDIAYLNGANSFYERRIANGNILSMMIGGTREALTRLFETELANAATKQVVLSKKIFTPNISTNGSEYDWHGRDYPFNTIVVNCWVANGGSIEFVDTDGKLLYKVTGSDNKFVRISYSTYGDRLYFEQMDTTRVSGALTNE